MPHGLIVKGIGGFYYVKSGDKIIECKARGKFRNEKVCPMVGDRVEFIEKENECVIDRINTRKNMMDRPPIANIEQVVIIFAAAKPEPSLDLLNRFLLIAEYNHMGIIICINKIDLVDIEYINEKKLPYKDAGYNIIYTSTFTNQGIYELKQILKGKITVFAGPSGVGKSSIMNALQPSFNTIVGDISSKVNRGKHTTRHSELLELEEGGFVADTPGFTSIDIDVIKKDQLELYFPEFIDYLGMCKFSGCSHISEPGCAIKNAVDKNNINKDRYNVYIKLYNELSKVRRKYK